MITEKRKTWKKIAAGVLGLIMIGSGLFFFEKRKVFSRQAITGLYFHDPSTNVFEKSILWFKENKYAFISSEQLLNILNGHHPFPKRAVWITLDDGWRDNITNVIPLIIKHNIPVTFFISSGPVERDGVFWFSLVRAFKNDLPLAYRNNVKKLWSVDEKKRSAVVEELTKIIAPPLAREAMSVDDVRSISNIPLVTLGSHTVNHVITTNCTDRELKEEIIHSKLKLEQWGGRKVNLFSYPNGDHGEREKRILQEAGITLAATTQKEPISKTTDPFLVPRFCINNDAFFPEIVCQIVGVWGKYMAIASKITKMVK